MIIEDSVASTYATYGVPLLSIAKETSPTAPGETELPPTVCQLDPSKCETYATPSAMSITAR